MSLCLKHKHLELCHAVPNKQAVQETPLCLTLGSHLTSAGTQRFSHSHWAGLCSLTQFSDVYVIQYKEPQLRPSRTSCSTTDLVKPKAHMLEREKMETKETTETKTKSPGNHTRSKRDNSSLIRHCQYSPFKWSYIGYDFH